MHMRWSLSNVGTPTRCALRGPGKQSDGALRPFVPTRSIFGGGTTVASLVPMECPVGGDMWVYSESPWKGLIGTPEVCMLTRLYLKMPGLT